jgi:hypothetical protein
MPNNLAWLLRNAKPVETVVSTWRASNKGNPIEKRKLNLKIHPKGISDRGDGPRGYTPINLYSAAAGIPAGEAFVWLSQLRSGSIVVNPRPKETAPETTPEASPVSVPAEPADNADELAQLNGWAPDEEPEAIAPQRERLAELTECPGLVGDIIDWITDTARRPNRVLALGAAVTIIGTLIGRRAAMPTRSATRSRQRAAASSTRRLRASSFE